MTITSTGPSGFHLKPLVAVFAVAAIVTGVLAIAQTIGTDSPQSTPAPAGVSTATVKSYAGPSGLAQALAQGKLDAGLATAEIQPYAGSTRALEIVVIEGQGGLHNALIGGKLTMDTTGVQYAPGPEAAASPSGLAEAFADGKFDGLLVTTETTASAGSAPVPEIVVIEGQGGLHDALIAGKLTMDTTGVQYVASLETAATASGLLAAFDAGRLNEGVGDRGTVPMSPPTAGTPTVSGGHQE
jgi:hypothetical protein